MGARFTIFWACRPCGPAGWLALLLTKAGDVETNPGPTTLNKKVWICDICHKEIYVRKQISIRCNRIEHWVHLRCIRYPPSTIHRYLDLPSTQRIQTHTSHRHNTTPSLPTLVQAPYPLPTYTTHATANKTQTHVQHSPVPRGLVKPKHNSLIHSPPSPPTPLRAKHIHMSHTPPTPLTSTSHVLDKTPEPRVPLIHALTATTPHPDTTPALPSPSLPHTLTHTHIITVTATPAHTT